MTKAKLGFQGTPRTKQEIDQDYTHNAVQIGHKARVVSQLQEEIDEHIEKLILINSEAMRLQVNTAVAAVPAEAVQAAPPAPPEGISA